MARECGLSELDYLAGIWRSTLPESLFRWGHKDDCYRLENGAPSWSWASLSGQASPGQGYYATSEVEIIDAECEVRGDPFGHILNGSISLVGRLVKMNIESVGNFQANTWLGESGEKELLKFVRMNEPQLRKMGRMALVYGLVLMKSDRTRFRINPGGLTNFYGLFLQRSGLERGIFKKVGVFWFDSDDIPWKSAASSQILDNSEY